MTFTRDVPFLKGGRQSEYFSIKRKPPAQGQYHAIDVISCIQSLVIVVQGGYPLGGRGHTAELLGDEVISEIALAHEKSSAQITLRWNLQKGVAVIPGTSNPELFDSELLSISMLTKEEI